MSRVAPVSAQISKFRTVLGMALMATDLLKSHLRNTVLILAQCGELRAIIPTLGTSRATIMGWRLRSAKSGHSNDSRFVGQKDKTRPDTDVLVRSEPKHSGPIISETAA